jgi:peptide/nickel transport system substrate-binding protein
MPKFNPKRFLIAIAVLSIMILTACSGEVTDSAPTQPPADESSASTAAPTEAGDTQPAVEPTAPEPPPEPAFKAATFIFPQDFDSFSPLYSQSWFSTVTQQLWNCWAWDFDENNTPQPVLLKEMPSIENGGISPDGLQISMQLRDDVVWSDGQPLTARDFVFTYEMATSDQNLVASRYPYNQVASVEAPDERTVVVRFYQPFAPWTATLWQGLLPEHVLNPVFQSLGSLDTAEWNQAPTVGCGPYVFSDRQAAEYTRFVSNENYWLGAPKINEIEIRVVFDEATQVTMLKNGSADLGVYLPYATVPELQSAGVEVRNVFSGFNEIWYFFQDPNQAHPALLDQRVRQAIALAIDKETITREVLLSQTKPAVNYWDNTPYTDPSLSPWPYDPARANQLLDEAGWIDSNGNGTRDQAGFELVLSYGTTDRPDRLEAQQRFIAQLAQVGIGIEPHDYPLETLLLGYNQGGPAVNGQLDIWQYASVTSFPDPDTPEWLCSQIPAFGNPDGENWTRVCDPELDRLFQEQITQVDLAQRQATFQQISRIIYDQVYMLGIWQDPDLWGLSSSLQNVRISGVTPFFNIREWELTN